MPDLKPLDAWSTQEHVNYVRRNNGRRGNPNPDRGRPPLVGEGGPTPDELAAAGLRGKADPSKRSPAAYNSALDGNRNAHGQRALRSSVDAIERELNYATNSKIDRIDGVPKHARIAQLQAQLARQRADLLAATNAQAADDQDRRKRLADDEAREQASGPPPGHETFGAESWVFDAKGKPVARIGRRGPSGHDEAA
jgi:hypothetical protein